MFSFLVFFAVQPVFGNDRQFIALLGLYVKVEISGGCREDLCDKHQSQKVGKRCSRSLQPLEKTTVTQAVLLQPMVKQFETDFHLQTVENPHQSKWICPEGSRGPWRSAHAGADFLAGAVPYGRPTLEKSVTEGLYSVEKTSSGVVCEGLYIVRGTPCWSKETM